MATIQILIMDDADRRAFVPIVDDRHSIITEPEVQNADLYLVDDASLPQYQTALEAQKHEDHPVFCPVVLITRDGTAINAEFSDPVPEESLLIVNEVVDICVEREVLARRITNLLIRRRQTIELKAKSERFDYFSRTLRHELRNQLNILDGYFDLGRNHGDSEAFDTCQSAIDQIRRLLEEILLVLKGTDVEIEQEPVDIADLSATCWELVPKSDATLNLATSQRIVADEGRLTQLLTNVFQNAVEHGEANVTITVGELDDGFYIEDDGPGIPAEERARVFEEGYSTKESGSGLGLAVVKTVVDAHEWTVSVTEGAAGGARFEITGVDVVKDKSITDRRRNR